MKILEILKSGSVGLKPVSANCSGAHCHLDARLAKPIIEDYLLTNHTVCILGFSKKS